MGLIAPGIPKDLKNLVLEIKQHSNVSYFIETGTNKGITAAWAADHFDKVITIERSKAYYEMSRKGLSNFSNVDLRYDDSRNVFADIMPELKSSTVFWLDSHWCGRVSAGVDDQCPLTRELELIALSIVNHYILIDDARFFLSPPPEPYDYKYWPSISDVFEAINKINSNYYIAVHNDVIIAVPGDSAGFVKKYLQVTNTEAEVKRMESMQHPYWSLLKHISHVYQLVTPKLT